MVIKYGDWKAPLKVKNYLRDKIKDTVFEKYNIPLIRFNTTGSGEKEKLINKLSEILGNA